MIDELRAHFPSFDSLEESELLEKNQILGWQATAFNNGHIPVGSGFHRDKLQARKIAIAEYIERSMVVRLRNSSSASDWELDRYPTACGFAAGFDLSNTILRSTCEAVERWALAQWIDNNCRIDNYRIVGTSISSVLLANFSEVQSFRKVFTVFSQGVPVELTLVVLICFTLNGAFVGSAVRGKRRRGIRAFCG